MKNMHVSRINIYVSNLIHWIKDCSRLEECVPLTCLGMAWIYIVNMDKSLTKYTAVPLIVKTLMQNLHYKIKKMKLTGI